MKGSTMTTPTSFAKPVDGALYMARLGYKVFPLLPGGKKPAFEGWQEWAETATTRKVEDFGRANPTNNWGVYCGPSGLFVLDIDNKGDKKGQETLDALEIQNSALPETLSVITPSGGRHLYFTGSGKSTAGAIGPGLDTRSIGGYVVAPGSRIGESAYELLAKDVAGAPQWLLQGARAIPPVVLSDDIPVEDGARNKVLTSMAGTMRARGMNHDAILAALTVMNDSQLSPPLPIQEVETIARSVSRYAPQEAKVASDFLEPVEVQAEHVDQIRFDLVPARPWVMQDRYLGGFISVVISPGGIGKSTLSMLDAIAIASGKPLTGFPIHRPGAAWVYNTEDPRDEMARRFHAAAIHHGIRYGDLPHKIHFTSGRDKPFILAKADQNGIVINKDAIDRTCEYIQKNDIKLFLADPFVRTHEVNENDNMQIDKVMWCFSRIADRTGCAIGLIHHTSKQGSNTDNVVQGNMNAARGATALVYAARIAHTINGMTEDEAQKFGIGEDRRRWYMRLDNAKANMQPPASGANWFERVNITLPNTDQVGTVKTAELVDIRNEKKKEAQEASRQDLAVALSRIMVNGDILAIKDAYMRVLSDPRATFLFEGYSNDRRAEQYLIALLGAGCGYSGKFFTLNFNAKARQKYTVLCSEIDPDSEAFK